MEELENAIKAINTGKSEDIYGLSIENIIYAGKGFQQYMLDLINNIISHIFVVKPRCNGDCCFVNIVLKLFLAICSSILHSIGRTTIPL
jgi:hypothetical protein